MQRFAHFSKHALKRIANRTALAQSTIANMLDYDGAVDIGTIPVFNKKHWLLYSSIEDCHFVAVQDGFTGLVITFLPLGYDYGLPSKISGNALIDAKNKAATYEKNIDE